MNSQPHWSRRRFLAAAALSPFFTRIAWSGIPTNPDVIIIGAGAAGLAAAKTLLAQNISCLILEGNNRIGGRAYTDHSIFGVPYDQGCHWLHNYEQNPWVPYAQQNGFTVYQEPHDDDEDVNIFDGDVSKIGNSSDFHKTCKDIEKAIDRVASNGTDVSAEDAVKDINSPWKQLAKNWFGQWDMGKDFDSFSTVDWDNSPWSTNYFCKEGFGSIVAHYGQALPVQLNTAVTGIDWSGNDIKVQTAQGVLRCKKVIITVSTGILAANNIKFTPSLSTEKQESFHKISMGCYNNIALQFKKDIF